MAGKRLERYCITELPLLREAQIMLRETKACSSLGVQPVHLFNTVKDTADVEGAVQLAQSRRKAHNFKDWITTGLFSKALLVGGMDPALHRPLDAWLSCLDRLLRPVVDLQVRSLEACFPACRSLPAWSKPGVTAGQLLADCGCRPWTRWRRSCGRPSPSLSWSPSLHSSCGVCMPRRTSPSWCASSALSGTAGPLRWSPSWAT